MNISQKIKADALDSQSVNPCLNNFPQKRSSFAKFFVLIITLFLSFAFAACDGGGGNDGGGLKPGDSARGPIKIGDTEYEKTDEVYIVVPGTQATVTGSDSSWDTYHIGNGRYKGVFINGRKVMLSAFAMGKYEVTQELYEAVMGSNPSNFTSNPATTGGKQETQELRPVETVTWYQAVAFCNALTAQLGIKDSAGNIDYAYYTDNTYATAYTTGTAIYYKQSSKGYRLPTEAEWEFAARGGDASKPEWKYSYAGAQTQKAPAQFASSPSNDDALEAFGWYDNNSNSDSTSKKTHEVGLKTANGLGLFDMSGNMREWCWDWYDDRVTANDSAYEVGGVVTNPTGPTASRSYRVDRGGGWDSYACNCAVSIRGGSRTPDYAFNGLGFRVCRSL